MREILFRGKHMDNGQWCEGNLAVRKNGIAIITPDDTPCGVYGQVRPDTVGQYTGLTDKSGKKIFEGDVVRWGCRYDYDCYEESLQHPEEYEGCDPGQDLGIGVVKWFGDEGYPAFDIAPNEFESNGLSYLSEDCDFVIEVIGNIHDNPELLKEKNNA